MILLMLTLLLFAMVVAKQIAKKNNKGFVTYIIKKGKHYSVTSVSPWWPMGLFHFWLAPKTMRFVTVFGEGIAATNDGSGDLNKLYGMTLGADVHYRSARLAWLYDPKYRVIRLYAYSYENGKRSMAYLCSVRQYEQFFTTMYHDGKSGVRITINDDDNNLLIDYVIIMSKESGWLRFKCYPYFGGDLASPVDCKIFIQDL